jgi:hypothetical protein
MARRYRPRKEFKFWLYHDLPEDKRLMEFIQFCKTTQQFARMVRNGLRLMWSLGEGDTSVLHELFPWTKTQPTLPAPAADTEKLERQIADLKRIMLEQGSLLALGEGAPPARPALASMKKLALPVIDDEDEDTIVLNKSTNTSVMDNFFASFAKLGS